jgi:hypothetical protein
MSALPAQPSAAERWLPGEYAECTHEGPWFLRGIKPNRAGPARGEVLRVRSVTFGKSPWTGRPTRMLTFDRWPMSAFPSSSFCKTARPPWRDRISGRVARRQSQAAGVGAVTIVTAVCCAAAAVVSQFMGDN